MKKWMMMMIVCMVVMILYRVEAEENDQKYKDSKQPLNVRIKDLMKRMSLEEKIGQMTQVERMFASPSTVNKYFIGN